MLGSAGLAGGVVTLQSSTNPTLKFIRERAAELGEKIRLAAAHGRGTVALADGFGHARPQLLSLTTASTN